VFDELRPESNDLLGSGEAPSLPVPRLAQDLSKKSGFLGRGRLIEALAKLPHGHRFIPEKIGHSLRVFESCRQRRSPARTHRLAINDTLL